MKTELNNLIAYVQSKDIEQGLDLSKLETLVDALKTASIKVLKDEATEDLRSELESRGYFTNNMWQLDDVQMKIDEFNEANKTNIEFNDDEKMEILIEAFANDATYAQIWESIEAEIEAKIEYNSHL